MIMSAVATAALAVAAFWQGCESRRAAESAIEESRQMRIADHLPALLIQGRNKDGKWLPGIHVSNIGKSPATLVSFGFCVEGSKGEHEATNREILPAGAGMPFHEEIFTILAKKYAEKVRSGPSHPIEYYVQYADIFENEYRQYFYYAPGLMAVGRFERIDKNSAEYKPVRKPPE